MRNSGYTLLIEGPDRTGKTTLAKKVKEEFEKRYMAKCIILSPHRFKDIEAIPENTEKYTTAYRGLVQAQSEYVRETNPVLVILDRRTPSLVAYWMLRHKVLGAPFNSSLLHLASKEPYNLEPDFCFFFNINKRSVDSLLNKYKFDYYTRLCSEKPFLGFSYEKAEKLMKRYLPQLIAALRRSLYHNNTSLFEIYRYKEPIFNENADRIYNDFMTKFFKAIDSKEKRYGFLRKKV